MTGPITHVSQLIESDIDTSVLKCGSGPEPELYFCENTVVSGNNFILASSQEKPNLQSRYLAGRNNIITPEMLKTKNQMFLQGTYIIAGNSPSASSFNYYHWVKQVVSNILFCRKHIKDQMGQEKICILGPELDEIRLQYIKRIPGIEYTVAAKDAVYRLEKSVCSNLLWGAYDRTHHELFTKLFDEIFSDIDTSNIYGDKIFINRQDSKKRTVANSEEVEATLTSLDFNSLSLSDLPLDHQIGIFRNARSIAGVHGAGFANLLFSPEGQMVYELFQENYLNPCFSAIAKCRQLNYFALVNQVIYTSPDQEKNNHHSQKMIIDCEMLYNVLADSMGN